MKRALLGLLAGSLFLGDAAPAAAALRVTLPALGARTAVPVRVPALAASPLVGAAASQDGLPSPASAHPAPVAAAPAPAAAAQAADSALESGVAAVEQGLANEASGEGLAASVGTIYAESSGHGALSARTAAGSTSRGATSLGRFSGSAASESVAPPAAAPASWKAPADATLSFGGSFSPPTMQHAGLLVHLMHRLGFTKAELVVAWPYKKDAAPAEVSAELTTLSVENAHEVLELNSVPYRDFQPGEGRSSWTGAGGRRYELSANLSDVEHKTTQTLDTLTRLKDGRGGDAKRGFWLSGGDSFGSVPTWTPQWRELFELSNWIVVARPGFEGVDFAKPDPLRGLLPDDFVDGYDYSFEAATQMHVYAGRAGKPGIYIVDQPTLNDSSSENRKSLKEDPERERAQDGLQPSVFRRAVEKGYFSGEGGYRALTERNLDIYTTNVHGRIASPDGEPVDAQERADFERLSSALAAEAKKVSGAEAARPRWRRLAAAGVEHVEDLFANVASLGKVRQAARAFYERFGKDFGKVYLFGELILEPFIAPAVAWVIAGPAAAAAAPFLHVNEFFVMPAFILYKVAARVYEMRRLAGGEFSLYSHLTSYRRRLARGDPEAIVARVELGGGLSVDGAPLTLNVVKSRLSKRFPLWLRRLDDRRVTWHDLNVSTNELAAALRDPGLAGRLDELSGRRRGLAAHRALAAIHADPAALTRLELFLAHRYFKRLALGQVDQQLVGGFSPAEREALASLKARVEEYRRALLPTQFEQLAEIVADYYAWRRVGRNESFDDAFADFVATRYPDERRAPGDEARVEKRLALLRAMASGAAAPRASPTSAAAVRETTLENAAVEYARANAALFELRPAAAGLRLLPASSRGDDLDRANLVWEMSLLREHVARRLSVLGEAYKRAEKHLAERRADKAADHVFWDARSLLEDELAALDARLLRLEYEWLRLKFPHQVGAAARDERLIPGYDGVAARYAELRAAYDARLEAYQDLTHMMFGTIPSPVGDPARLRADVGERAGLGSRAGELGRGFMRRWLLRSAALLRRLGGRSA